MEDDDYVNVARTNCGRVCGDTSRGEMEEARFSPHYTQNPQ
jgi:hypothetical protein